MPRNKYRQPEYIASGRSIARLTHSLKQVKDWTMEETMDYVGKHTKYSHDIVYRWQQGHSLPKPAIVEILAQIGCHEADLSREWCEELLDATHYPTADNLLNKLWGPKQLRTIPYRLARREHRRLIGRRAEMEQLQKFLSPQYAVHLITIDGIGGVGKTALALDIAYQSLQASTGEIIKPSIPTFDAIISVSAKQQYLTPQGILQRTLVHRTLRQIFQEVATALERYDIRSLPLEEQLASVREALGRQRTLLIVDNLETMEDKQEIMSFLYELPPTVKVVMTTREMAIYAPIRLEQLEKAAALELIEAQAEEQQAQINKKEILMLYERIGGIPAALVYAVGQRAAGYSFDTVLNNVPQASGDVARFCFQGAVEPLRGQKAHMILMAFALFPQMPARAAVAYVAGLEADPIAAEEAISQLQRLSLIREFHDRFRMLPLTREYAMAELKAQPEFEREARERWIKWYQDFAQRYGGHDKQEWHVHYDHLDEEWENLQAVFDWCANNERYDVVKSFWCAEEPGSVVDFTTLYGYWDDRLTWLKWLMETAEGRGDWLTMIDTIASIAITQTLMYRYDDAENLFKRGHSLLTYATPEIQARLLSNNAYLSTWKERFEESRQLLDRARKVTTQVQEPLRTRININIDYDYAAIFFRTNDFAAARTAFINAMTQARNIGWNWLENYAQNYLADIAIIQENYDEAEGLLETGLLMVQRNKEKRRIASYKRSFANLRQKQGRLDEALKFAEQARENFTSLGATLEVQRMDRMIQDLHAQMSD